MKLVAFTQIAYDLGFQYSQHFNRMFKKTWLHAGRVQADGRLTFSFPYNHANYSLQDRILKFCYSSVFSCTQPTIFQPHRIHICPQYLPTLYLLPTFSLPALYILLLFFGSMERRWKGKDLYKVIPKYGQSKVAASRGGSTGEATIFPPFRDGLFIYGLKCVFLQGTQTWHIKPGNPRHTI